MALVKNFYTLEHRDGTTETYALARDVTNDRVFVLKTFAEQAGKGVPDVETKVPIGAFLLETGAAQQELLQLIGSLVPESSSKQV